MFDFTGQVIIVTGASGNLGGAVARAFARSGAHLVLPDRSLDRLQPLVAEIGGADKHSIVPQTDLTEASSVNAMVQAALDRFGKVDVLAHTVGGFRAGKLPHETELETWDLMHNLNARATFLVNRAVIPPMLAQQRGKIVNTAARSALHSAANDVAYSASKSAVARITESMAAAYKKHDINVNAILPGTIDTPQNRGAMPKADHSRWVTPEALAQIMLFLASDASAPIHGALIPAYGLS